VFIHSEFHFGTADERELAGKMINDAALYTHYKDEPQVWIFDRGFQSLNLIQKLLEYQLYFVMRVSSSFLKEVNEFHKSKYVDRMVHINYSKQRASANHVHSDGISEFDLRCVRIKLSSGEDEILITNLKRKEFPKRDIKEIYRLRWGIETGFNYLKNAAFVEKFVSRTENGIAQDYYVSLLVYNFTTCICGSMYPDIPQKRKYKYKINRRTATRLVYQELENMLFISIPCLLRTLNALKSDIIKHLSPIRPNRSFPRNFDSSRHSTCHSRAVLS